MKKFVIAIISIILISGVVQAYNDEATKQLVQLMGDIGRKDQKTITPSGISEFLDKVKQLITNAADPNAKFEWFAPQGTSRPGYNYFDLMSRLIAAGRVEGVDNALLEDVIRTALVHGAKTGLDQWGNEQDFMNGILSRKLDFPIIQLLFDYATPEEKAHIATTLEGTLQLSKIRGQSEPVKAQIEKLQAVKSMLDKSMKK